MSHALDAKRTKGNHHTADTQERTQNHALFLCYFHSEQGDSVGFVSGIAA